MSAGEMANHSPRTWATPKCSWSWRSSRKGFPVCKLRLRASMFFATPILNVVLPIASPEPVEEDLDHFLI